MLVGGVADVDSQQLRFSLARTLGLFYNLRCLLKRGNGVVSPEQLPVAGLSAWEWVSDEGVTLHVPTAPVSHVHQGALP